MRFKLIVLLSIVFIICGCSNEESEVSCLYKNEKDENMKSYIRVTLISNEGVVEKERLYSVYKFKNSTEAEKKYSQLESVLEQDSSVKVEQMEERVVAKGEKDVTSMQYDEETKIAYYEQLGYTCK